jgi:hypothetical protein
MSREDCLTELHELLIYIRDIQSAFCELFFQVVPKVCYKAAKILDKPSIWVEEGPAFFLPIVIANLS